MSDFAFSTIVKTAVPIFFMISGSLLLNKEENISATLKRIKKIAVGIALFVPLYTFVDAMQRDLAFNFSVMIKAIFCDGYWHLWFLYAYISFILSLPFLRKFVISLTPSSSVYFLITIGGCIFLNSIFSQLLGIQINYNLKMSWFWEWAFLYPIVGYIIDHKLIHNDLLTCRSIVFCWSLAIAGTTLGAFFEYIFLKSSTDKFNETFLVYLCLLNSITVYITIKWFCQKFPKSVKMQNFVLSISKCTYGIYLIHIFILWKISFIVNAMQQIEFYLGQRIGILFTCAFTMAICFILTWSLRKLKIGKYIL